MMMADFKHCVKPYFREDNEEDLTVPTVGGRMVTGG